MRTQTFSDYLRQSIVNQKLSIKATAEKAGISRQNLHKILNGDIEQAKLSTFIKLAHALNEHPLDLFRAYFDKSEFPPVVNKKKFASHHQHDNTEFIADLTYPDYSLVNTGQTFKKQWRVQNSGEEVWENRKLICLDDQLSVHSVSDDNGVIHGLTPKRTCVSAPIINPGENRTGLLI